MDADEVMRQWSELLGGENLGDGEHFFDRFKTPELADRAWALIPEHVEIRERIALVNHASALARELRGIPGYNAPRLTNAGVSPELLTLMADYLRALIPLADEDEESELSEVLRSTKFVQPGRYEDAPENSEFDEELYELHSGSVLNHLPTNEPYGILYTYAVSLTKDDRVAAFVLWPCLNEREALEKPYALGFDLWRKQAYFWRDENGVILGTSKI